METQFSWEKKYCITGKIDSLWTPRNIISLDGSNHQFHKTFVHICLACNGEKTLQLKITTTKKRMNMANFINIYTNIYTYIICEENDSK